jgi:hypothetical protein
MFNGKGWILEGGFFNREKKRGRRWLSGCDLENGEELLSQDRRSVWIGIALVEKHRLLETVKVCIAVRTTPQVPPDFPASPGLQSGVELKLKVRRDLSAQCSIFVNVLHDRCRCLRRPI